MWANIAALLEAAEMSTADIVSITTYAVTGHALSGVMAARDRAMGPTARRAPSSGSPRSPARNG